MPGLHEDTDLKIFVDIPQTSRQLKILPPMCTHTLDKEETGLPIVSRCNELALRNCNHEKQTTITTHIQMQLLQPLCMKMIISTAKYSTEYHLLKKRQIASGKKGLLMAAMAGEWRCQPHLISPRHRTKAEMMD